jgi:hypothetical protein
VPEPAQRGTVKALIKTNAVTIARRRSGDRAGGVKELMCLNIGICDANNDLL